MTYLYGDSTPSPLESNFIQFLCDALDVSVGLLLAGERMAQCSARTAALEAGAARELRSLEALATAITRALEGAPKGEAASPTTACAAAIAAQAGETLRQEVARVQEALAASVAAVDAEDARERAGCLKALETLIRAHDPPGATTTFHLLPRAGGYVCARTTRTPYSLEWDLAIDVAPPHPFAQLARVDRFFPQLEISAPELGGWLRKEVRNRTNRLEKLLLLEMRLPAKGGALQLRSSADEGASGFDVEYDEDGARVRVRRVPAPAGEPGDLIELSEVDAAKLTALRAKVGELARAIPRAEGRLEDAKLDDRSVRELRDPAIVVDRLVEAMAPIVAEIARRSLASKELVLKQLLGDNRREEIFVSKATLLEKLAPLSEPLRAVFKPLGLSGGSLRPPAIPAAMRRRLESAGDAH